MHRFLGEGGRERKSGAGVDPVNVEVLVENVVPTVRGEKQGGGGR